MSLPLDLLSWILFSVFSKNRHIQYAWAIKHVLSKCYNCFVPGSHSTLQFFFSVQRDSSRCCLANFTTFTRKLLNREDFLKVKITSPLQICIITLSQRFTAPCSFFLCAKGFFYSCCLPNFTIFRLHL